MDGGVLPPSGSGEFFVSALLSWRASAGASAGTSAGTSTAGIRDGIFHLREFVIQLGTQ